MRDYLYIAESPVDEKCAQVGQPGYFERGRVECRCFIGQLRRMFGNEPTGARLSIKTEQHDFGSYSTVVCHYDDTFPESVEYAFKCEGELPEKWDLEALRQLALSFPEFYERLK